MKYTPEEIRERAEHTIRFWNCERTAAVIEDMLKAVEAAKVFSTEAIVLSEATLDAYRGKPDSDECYGWDLGYWRRGRAAALALREALAPFDFSKGEDCDESQPG